MVRTVKEHEYAGKRNSILDVVQRLVYTKGYEQMTIQDILNDLQISKGAFYHYFDSKPALLEALIERIADQIEQVLLPIVHDPVLPTLEKLQRFFEVISQWKTARKEFLLALLRVWYADDNAIVHQKLFLTGTKLMVPLLTVIIHQGVREGVLTTAYPDEVAETVLSLVQGLGDTLGRLLLSFDSEHDDLGRIERTCAAYSDALERVLGVPTGSLSLVDAKTLKEWFISLDTVEGRSTLE